MNMSLTAMADQVDELFELRNNFYTGGYQAAISEALSVHPSRPQLQLEKNFFLYRSYVALHNYTMVLNEIPDSASEALLSVKLLASYLGNPASRENVLQTLEANKDAVSSVPQLQVMCGVIYMHEQNYEEALRCLHSRLCLESNALIIQIYLKMFRLDLAEKELKVMQQRDEDSTLTQLANAWINVAVGGAKLQEAFYIFQELIDKYQATPMLLNGLAVCQLNQGNYAEAETHLKKALEKSPNDPQTLANMIACEQHLHKGSDKVNVYLKQLRSTHPTHSWVQNLDALEKSFDRNAQRYASS